MVFMWHVFGKSFLHDSDHTIFEYVKLSENNYWFWSEITPY